MRLGVLIDCWFSGLLWGCGFLEICGICFVFVWRERERELRALRCLRRGEEREGIEKVRRGGTGFLGCWRLDRIGLVQFAFDSIQFDIDCSR